MVSRRCASQIGGDQGRRDLARDRDRRSDFARKMFEALSPQLPGLAPN